MKNLQSVCVLSVVSGLLVAGCGGAADPGGGATGVLQQAEVSDFHSAMPDVQRFLTTPQMLTTSFPAQWVGDGYAGVVLKFSGMEMLLEVDVSEFGLVPDGNVLSFDPSTFPLFEAIDMNNQMYAVSRDEAPGVISDYVPVRTTCSRQGRPEDGPILDGPLPITLNGASGMALVRISRLAPGATTGLATSPTSDIQALGLDIGVWSTDCKNATGCNAPDCSASFAWVTVTGFCHYFNTIFSSRACRCIIT